MARIMITPEQVQDAARQFESASQESQNLISRLRGTMSSVESQWEGVSKQRFYQDYQQWQNQMSQFVDLLRQISQQLQATAERFRQVDQG